MADHRRSKSSRSQADVAETIERRRVWVLVPFGAPTSTSKSTAAPDFAEPHVTADAWVTSKNKDPSNRTKAYQKIGLSDMGQVNFERGDRLYIHGHGSSHPKYRNRIYGGGDQSYSAQELRDAMIGANDKIFQSEKVDIRMASCFSANATGSGKSRSNPFAQHFAASLESKHTRGGVKGYYGEFNVLEMTRGGTRHKAPTDQRKLAGLTKVNRNLHSADDPTRMVVYSRDKEEFRASNQAKRFDIPVAAPVAATKVAGKRKKSE